MKTKLIILAVLVVVLGGGWYYYKNYSSPGWKNYKDANLGIEFKYPSDGKLLVSNEVNKRIQNYDFDSKGDFDGLLEGEYYIEIGPSRGLDCSAYMRDIEPTKINDSVVRIGRSIDAISDAGGAVLTLCVDTNDNAVITVRVTEAGSDNDLAHQIFSTFKFTK